MHHFLLGSLAILAVAGYWKFKCGIVLEYICNRARMHETVPTYESFPHDLVTNGSSVWCRGENRSTRLCRFSNLCFHSDSGDFVFILSPKSVQMGVGSPSGITRFPLVDLSSVQELNTLSINLVHVPSHAINTFDVHYIPGETFLLGRFKPDNIMHVFHDDLLPLYATFHELCSGNVEACIQKYNLALFDIQASSEYLSIYELFSKNPQFPSKTFQPGTLTCFQDSVAGLSQHSVWYRYGFTEPQHPKEGCEVTGEFVRGFAKHIFAKLTAGDPGKDCDETSRYAVLIGRKTTRLIINDIELSNAIVHATGHKVVLAYLETDDLKQIISLVSCAELLVGVHGAHLMLALFLRQGATLLELFPYAVPPDDYTPYKSLATLPGMDIVYKSWSNKWPQNSITHPDRPAEYGGLLHLKPEERKRIEGMDYVAKHLCCSDPAWLYRIYQDTVVDIPSLLDVLLDKTMPKTSNSHLELYPGTVRHLSCSPSNGGFWISWEPPWNLEVINASSAVS